MLRQKIAEARKQRAKLIHDARAILEKAEKEKRELSPEEQEQWDTMMAEVESLKARVDKLEQLVEAEAGGGEGEGQGDDDEETNSRRGRIVPPGQQAGGGEPRDGRASKEYREAFYRALRGEASGEEIRMLNSEARALSVGTKAAGGYVVPDEFERTLVKKLDDENVMRRLCTVLPTVSGERDIPVEASIGSAAWLDEAGAYTESDVTFGQVVLSAFKLGRIIKVSEELLNDSFFDLEPYLTDVFARVFGSTEETAMVVGDGTKKPTGVVADSAKGADAAKGAITSDNLIDLFHGLRRPYRAKGTFLMADGTAKLVRKLKDSDGQYLWQPGLQLGQPDVLLGRPVEISDNVPAVGTSTKSVLFGDFSYYWIAQRTGVAMQRLNELYAANGQVGFKGFLRVDGKLTLSEAVVHLLHAAV